jgi:DNA repair exonuclease SbcCD ATPase subunit
MSTAESTPNAEAFQAEAGVAPTVATPDADASIATSVSSTETPATQSRVYTDEDLSKVRAQEKDKLYPQIDSLKAELAEIKRQREEELAAKRAEEEARAAEERAKAEADMDVRDLLKQKESEWQEQLERERQERERAFALWEREKNYAELTSYKQQLLEAERDNIMPELLDLLKGNTPDELNASVADLKERSSRILDSAQAAMQNARKEMTGSRVTAPPTGPLDINSEQRTLTAQEIAAMPMNEYAQYRQRLLSDKARGRGQGLFGNP